MKNKTIQIIAFIMLAGMVTIQSCKKKEDQRTPPSIKFINGSAYISGNSTVPADTTILVGVTVSRTEDELRVFNISHAYDNASATTTDTTETISGAEMEGFSREIYIQVRPVAGTEKYVFTTTDRDGNVASVNMVLTVQ